MALSETKWRRKSGSKVKSGCQSWQQVSLPINRTPFRSQLTESRARRIKCDEIKPFCFKCTSTNRKCEYFLDSLFRHTTSCTNITVAKSINPVTSKSSPDTPPVSLAPWIPGNAQEQCLFHAFREHVAPKLDGHFDSDFWNNSLLRIANSEPSVHYAILAIAAIDQPAAINPENFGFTSNEISVVFYNKAINSLKTCLTGKGQYQHTILLTCLLFICLELKRGNTEAALNHLQSGLGILCANEASVLSASELSDIRDRLVQIFYRFSIQGSLVGQNPPFNLHRLLKGVSSYTCDKIRSLAEARESLVFLFVEFLRPTFLHKGSSFPENPFENERFRRGKYIEWLREWDSKMGIFIIDCVPSPNAQDMLAVRSLRIQSLIATIWNATSLSSAEGELDECEFDAHVDKFNTILSHATLCTESSTPAPTTSRDSSSISFSFEMGIIFALYFTAIKCRSPHIRRRATHLLSKVYPQQEGMWDARVLAAICQYVTDFEEINCNGNLTENVCSWPLREQRIHGVYLLPHRDLEQRVQEVHFLWRPLGADAEWKDWVKDISF